MKPLSELENNWRENANLKHEIAPHASAQLLKCADLLQAWLREAHEELIRDTISEKTLSGWVKWVRDKLLGTTRTEGEKCPLTETEKEGPRRKPG